MKRGFLILGLVAALGFSGCSSKKVIVGVVLPETGDSSAYGTSLRSGVRLAFDEAARNQQPGLHLELVYRDSGSDPSRAGREAAGLYDRGAVVVIGGATSAEAKAMIPVAEKRESVILSPSATEPDLAALSNLFFRVYPSDTLEGQKAAEFVASRKIARLLLLDEDNLYTHGLLPVFQSELEKRGGSVARRIRIADNGWEKAVADALKELKPDAIYIAGYGEAILMSLLEIRNAGYEGLLLTTSAINTVDLVWRGGRLVEGIYFPGIGIDFESTQEPTKTFVARYKEGNNDLTPDIYAAHGYDAALAVIYALDDGPLQSNKQLAQRLMTLADQRGVTGPLVFDELGNIRRTLRILCVRDGKVQDCEPSPR